MNTASSVFALGPLSGLVGSASDGLWPARYAEMVPARVWPSGVAAGSRIGVLLGGFAPATGAALLTAGPTGWYPVAAFTSVTAAVSAISVTTAREIYRTPMAQLGRG